MPTLLDGVTTDTVGSLTSHSGPATVFVNGVMDGATVVIEASPSTTTSDAVKIDRSLMPQSIFVDRTGCCAIDGRGTYYLRAVLDKAGSSTDVTVTTTQ